MPKVKHYACFQFKEGTTEAQIKESFDALESLQGQIPGLLDLCHGPYESNEGLNDGFTHGFIMTFDSPQSRDEYLPHPVHEAVKAVLDQYLERVVVFDFNVAE